MVSFIKLYIEIKSMNKNKFNSMKDVVTCFNKIISLDKKTVGGRNFSVEFDQWQSDKFIKILNTCTMQ